MELTHAAPYITEPGDSNGFHHYKIMFVIIMITQK